MKQAVRKMTARPPTRPRVEVEGASVNMKGVRRCCWLGFMRFCCCSWIVDGWFMIIWRWERGETEEEAEAEAEKAIGEW